MYGRTDGQKEAWTARRTDGWVAGWLGWQAVRYINREEGRHSDENHIQAVVGT